MKAILQRHFYKIKPGSEQLLIYHGNRTKKKPCHTTRLLFRFLMRGGDSEVHQLSINIIHGKCVQFVSTF